jgi:hypothetical protein
LVDPSALVAVTSISGTPQAGATLTASQGSWNGSPTGFDFA